MEKENIEIENTGIDNADPAMWRLTAYIGRGCVKAYLRNIGDPTAEIRCLASASWDSRSLSDEETLRKIENVIYDNPTMLDDYSADIIIESDRVLWMPKEVAEDEESAATEYQVVFPQADDDDVFSDYDSDTVCAYHLVNGLAAFIRRTFPGARVSNQQAVLYRRFRLQPIDRQSVYVDLRPGHADIIILEPTRLLHASSHPASSVREAQYHVLNCMDVAGVDSAKAEVFISGDRTLRAELIKALREGLPLVRNTMLPRLVGPDDMPTPVVVCSTFNRSKA